MSRHTRRVAPIALLLITAVLLGACNTNRADPLASVPVASASPEVTPCNHCAPDLEALLPTSIGGTKLTAYSLDGPGFMSTGTPANRQALTDMLTRLGKTAADLSVAQASDPSGALIFKEGIFRVAGAASQALLDAWVAAQVQVIPTLTVGQTTIAGRSVTRLADSKQLDSPPTYVVARTDSLWLVGADDTKLVEEAIAGVH